MANRTAPAQTTGSFVYGIVPGDVQPTPDARGIGDPPAGVTVVRHRDVAALVSEVELDQTIGRPADLVGYQRLLDGASAVAPVLPVQFGAVLTGPEAVEQVLATYHDDFAAALAELEGRVEYLVRGRYVEEVLLGEVLAENAEAAELRAQIRGRPAEETVDLRIRIGEIVNQVVEAKRDADSQRMLDALAPIATQAAVRPATHEQDAANVAFLVESARQEEFRDALERLAGDWAGRVSLRLLGPLAPYDFTAPLWPGA
jgi:Gas vesicle synthesis protein GvpL/GvpF